METAHGTTATWAPLSLDPSGRTFFVGFADGIMRTYRFGCNDDENSATLLLSHVNKPHTKSVNFIRISDSGEKLITSDGEHIFFFDISKDNPKPEPIGFINLESKCNSIRFKPDGKHILVSSEAGKVLELKVPALDSHNSEHTFRMDFESLDKKTYQFISVMPKIEAARKAAEEAKNPKKKKKKGDKSKKEDSDEKAEDDVSEFFHCLITLFLNNMIVRRKSWKKKTRDRKSNKIYL